MSIEVLPKPTVRYSEVIIRKVCQRLSDGEPLTQILRDDEMPDVASFLDWVKGEKADPLLAQLYTRSREIQIGRMMDEILEIADDATNDWMERETKNLGTIQVVDHEHIRRSEIRIDTRKFLMSKLMPHQFGDRVQVQQLDENGQPTKPNAVVVIVDGAPAAPRPSTVPPKS